MIHAILAYLTCPLCLQGLTVGDSQVRCPAGHAYDIARQGYVTFTTGRANEISGDSADMVQAREAFLAAGHFTALADALAETVLGQQTKSDTELGDTHGRQPGGQPVIVDVGAGTGYYLAHLLRACPGAVGIAIDASRYALRRAARAHPLIGAVGADVRSPLPIRTGVASLMLDVFAPRNVAEMRRVLRPDGKLVIVMPTARHLADIVNPLGLVTVDDRKAARLREKLAGLFVRQDRLMLDLELSLKADDLLNLVIMGPSAHHRRVADVREVIENRWPDGVSLTASFTIEIHQPAR
ncbi:putative RNA methyltransferase [Frankia sp. Cppng1_Ct_nod]|uniref:putative RNA methyltransferase n=1 Tax=Frankia sp. Cppng1_Ct_nod TaxID=2897162 RepID=UPI001A94DE48|nr:methyltransferase domain-containing protein [Frankia sp. Cppng1_Ct_nod]